MWIDSLLLLEIILDCEMDMSDVNLWGFWLTVVGTICWIICFSWMHKISVKQNRLLDQLAQQAKRIEKFSKAEHDLIQEVHPQVAEIRDGLERMIEAVNHSNEERGSGR